MNNDGDQKNVAARLYADDQAMKNSPDQPADAAELRRRAEERLSEKQKRQRSEAGDQRTAEDTARLVHELQVHQVELEMQNKEIQQAHAQVETLLTETLREACTRVDALLAQYTDLYDSAPTGYMTLDREGTIRQVNLTGEHQLGVERSRLMNRRFGLFVAEGDRRTFSDFLRRVFANYAKGCCEVELLQEGHPPLFMRIEGVTSEDGQECRAVFVDITERKRAEEVLKKSAQLLRDTGAMAQVGGWELDLSTKEVLWTEEVCRIHGVAPGYKPKLEEALNFYAPESRPEVEVALKKAAETGEPWNLESLFIPSGSKDKIWVRSLGKAVYSGGKMVKLAGTFQNIDKYKRVEEQLRIALEKYRVLFESFPLGISVTDTAGNIIEANKESERLLGLRRAEQTQRKYDAPEWRIVRTDGTHMAADEYASVRAMKENKRIENVEMGIVKSGGEITWISVTAAPIPLENFGVAIAYGDITERKQVEERLLKEVLRTTALLRVAARLNAELKPDAVLNAVCEETALALGVPGASVALYEPDTKVFRIAASVGLAPELREHFAPIPRDLYDEYVQQHGSPFVVPKEQLWFNLPTVDLPRGGNPRTTVVATIGRVDQLIGTLNVHTLEVPRAFGDYDLELLQGLADEVALAIVNARLFTEVDQQREQLHALHGQLADTHEAERRQLAQELHDQVSQNLTAIGLNLNLLRSQMLPGTDAAVQARLTDSLALVEQTTESVRSVMANLRPSVLDDYGLVAALRWYGAEVAARTGLAIDVLGEEPGSRLTAPLENTLFRITQEALTNVIKHAHASQVTIAVELESGKVRLLIADNGIGFDRGLLTKPGNHRHWGLRVMTERAAAVSGYCRFESCPGKGTQVIVEVSP